MKLDPVRFKEPVKCRDKNCQREQGHRGLHMARYWDSNNCQEIIDEWGNANLAELHAAVEDSMGGEE